MHRNVCYLSQTHYSCPSTQLSALTKQEMSIICPLLFILTSNNLCILHPYTPGRLVLFIHLPYSWQINTLQIKFEATLPLLLWHSFYRHQGKKWEQTQLRVLFLCAGLWLWDTSPVTCAYCLGCDRFVSSLPGWTMLKPASSWAAAARWTGQQL